MRSRMRSDINVTPIIDVMLVLLILFMVMTPLTQTGHDVSLPETDATARPADSRDVVLEIDENGNLSINQQTVARDALPRQIRDLFDARTDKDLFLRAHERLRYADVVAVLDVVHGNGVERVGIVPPSLESQSAEIR